MLHIVGEWSCAISMVACANAGGDTEAALYLHTNCKHAAWRAKRRAALCLC